MPTVAYRLHGKYHYGNYPRVRRKPMLTREEIRDVALENKDRQGLTWPKVAEAIGRSPVYAAMLVYGYGQAAAEEAEALVKLLSLPPEAKSVLMKAPHREPAQPWPPTDPFIYRLYEMVLLYGPVFKDVAHEILRRRHHRAPSTCPWTSARSRNQPACGAWSSP